MNRICYTGRAYDEQFISNRSAHAAEVIAKDIGLKTAKLVQQVTIDQNKSQAMHMAPNPL